MEAGVNLLNAVRRRLDTTNPLSGHWQRGGDTAHPGARTAAGEMSARKAAGATAEDVPGMVIGGTGGVGQT